MLIQTMYRFPNFNYQNVSLFLGSMLLSRFSLRGLRSHHLYGNKPCHRHGNRSLHTTPARCTDYYKLLGVDKNFSQKRVKAAYFGVSFSLKVIFLQLWKLYII